MAGLDVFGGNGAGGAVEGLCGKFPAYHEGSPAEGLDVAVGDGSFGEAERALQLLAGRPFAGFEVAEERKRQAGGGGVAGESGFDGRADGEGLENAIERSFEKNVEEREDAQEIELGRLLADGRGQEFAKPSASKGHGEDGGTAMRGQRAGHGDGDQAADGIIADEEQGFADGGDGAGVSLESGVGQAKDAKTEGGIGGDELFEPA